MVVNKGMQSSGKTAPSKNDLGRQFYEEAHLSYYTHTCILGIWNAG
jgi:hypothetical protein